MALLVVRSGGYPAEVIRHAKTQLERAQTNIVGILLNSADLRWDGSYQYYYNYYSTGYGPALA